MGKIFRKLLFVYSLSIVGLFSVFAFSIGVFAAHPLYSAFSSANSGFTFNSNNGLVSASDTVVYRTGYYSVNGSGWQNFTLTGNLYNGDSDWLSGSSAKMLSSFGVGEHYIIVYSCTYSNSWDCHENKWQLLIINNIVSNNTGSLCSDTVCGVDEYCFQGVCLLNVSGHTYFVALWGDDSNSGTFEEPFYSWQRGVEAAQPGDIVYIRGGIWQPTKHITVNGAEMANIALIISPVGYGVGVSGTKDAPIRYYNYPGEKPIVDGSLVGPNENRWNGGIDIDNAEYIYMRGLTVSNIHQSPPDHNSATNRGKNYSEAYGIGANGANFIFENMVAHDIDGRGFVHWSYAWNEWDGPDAPFEYDNTSWINCDAYNLFDRYSQEPGNAADGWKVGSYYGNHMYWEGCRAFNYSDDGFDPHGAGYRTFKNCWAMASERYKSLSSWNIEGNGFKMTGVSPNDVPDYEISKENIVRVENSLAVNCNGSGGGVGFYNNILVNYEDQLPNRGMIYNNFAYRNGIGYFDANESVHRNNIVYDSQQIEATGEPYEVYMYQVRLNESHNTWIGKPYATDWWWKYNPAFNVTDEDFVNLDSTQLMNPRKEDGSLPDITFGHLAEGSDLIDGGIVMTGYHCSTAGEHPGEDCVFWYGSAPDLGAFESNY